MMNIDYPKAMKGLFHLRNKSSHQEHQEQSRFRQYRACPATGGSGYPLVVLAALRATATIPHALKGVKL